MAESLGGGPDLVIAGASRGGTSYLAAHLAAHPDIDSGTVKEPNYFSRNHELGAQWYDGLFAERAPGLQRMDASTSYTYPQFPEALTRLVEESPHTFVVYSVRDPLARAVSHYLYYHYYFRRDKAKTFGTALRASSFYADVSDYSYWLPRLQATLSDANLLVVPFGAVTKSGPEVIEAICRAIGIDPPAAAVAEEKARAHQNNVVEFRSERVRVAVKKFRRNRTYLQIRSTVGPHRVRRLRSLLTRSAALPSVAEALASCEEDQVEQLREMEARAWMVVSEHLADQDRRLGLDWSKHWASSEGSTEWSSESQR